MLDYRIFIISITILFSAISFTIAQSYKLDVNGNAKIYGNLDMNNGLNCIFIGSTAGLENRGAFNVGLGDNVLKNNNGNWNTAIGDFCLENNDTGKYNTAVGRQALQNNVTGIENVATGHQALQNNTIGIENVAIGYRAIYENTQGNQNTAMGYQALHSNLTGNGNVAVGHSTLYENFTGMNNTAIGYQAFDTGEFFANSTAIGYNSNITASNQIRIGNSSVSSIGGFEPWTTFSDKHLKNNIKKDIPGLGFITQLRPVSYQLDMESIAEWHETPDSLRDFKSEAVKGSIRYSGFLAQEVEEAAQEIGYEFSGVDAPKNEGDRYGLRYSQFVVPLVKAVQELEEDKQAATARIEKLEQELAELKALLIGDKQTVELSSNNKRAKLAQNNPNPFMGRTTIDYFIPDGFRQAVIRMADNNGKLVKDVEIYKSGAGQIELNAAQLNNGNYFYYLILDGQLVESKQMIRMKNE